MIVDKGKTNKVEFFGFILVYILLFLNAIITHDSIIAFISAFCGITYTILAGKGFPSCYIIGVLGSAFYSYLSFKNALWGNLILYACYYIPMQVTGFFQWSRNLKMGKRDIIKTSLSYREKCITFSLGIIISGITAVVLSRLGDTNPIFDSITTVFSVLGMYYTVKRVIEQWVIWIVVNGLSFIMWLDIVVSGEKVYSTLIMWGAYFVLAWYFLYKWKKEIESY